MESLRALHSFLGRPGAARGDSPLLESMRLHCRAQEALYPLRVVLPPVARFFCEPALHPRGA